MENLIFSKSFERAEGADTRHGQSRVILMRIMIRELRHSANKLRRVESNFGGLAAVGELFGSLPKLPHPIFFAQGKKYVGALSPEGAPIQKRHGFCRVAFVLVHPQGLEPWTH